MRARFTHPARGTYDIDVQADERGLHLQSDDTTTEWLWGAVQMHNGTNVLRFVGPEGAFFELPPAALAHALRTHAPASLRPPSRYDANRWAFALLLACVAVVGCSFFLIDLFSDQVAQHLPRRWEEELGSRLNGRFVTQYCETPEQYEVLRDLARRLADSAEAAEDVDVHIGRQQMENAYSLPGGSIVIDSRLLQFMNNSDELAGVLGHEIEHVIRHDVTRTLVRGTLASTLWSLAMGDYTAMVGIDPSALYKVAHLQFDRDAEWAADHGAVRMLTAAQISPQGLADFFKRMASQATWLSPSILRGHPSSVRRMQYLESSVPPEAVHWPEALSTHAWQVVHRGCDEHQEPWGGATAPGSQQR